MVIAVPSHKPFFIDHPDLKECYEKMEFEVLCDTHWLVKDLVPYSDSPDEVKNSWNRMHFHGLASFFTEIAMCYAYWLALVELGIEYPTVLLFHGNNVVIRIVSCWDRIGFSLNELFELGIPENRTYFDPVIQELCKANMVDHAQLERVRRLKTEFDKDAKVRKWRHKYVHRHGEYFLIEEEKKEGKVVTVTESFPLSIEDKREMVKALQQLLPQSFSLLKSAVQICSQLFPSNPSGDEENTER
jgi:translation initiation factor 1 (eIF-1/SUI1)